MKAKEEMMMHARASLRPAPGARHTVAPGLVLVLWAAAPAAADILYASTGNSNDFGGGRIYRIDTDAQTIALVGDTGFDRMGGVDFDNSGVLYGVAGGSNGPATLMTIDLNNATPTVIGEVAGVQAVDALAFDRSGTLWGGGYDDAIGRGILVTIDPATAQVLTSVVLNGTGNDFVPGLDFRSDGVLFGSRGNALNRGEDLVQIDTDSGDLTRIGRAEWVISDIAFGRSGTLFGCSPAGWIWSIDASTGEKTFIFDTGVISLSGLTSEIPAPGAGALLLAGLVAFGRRR